MATDLGILKRVKKFKTGYRVKERNIAKKKGNRTG